MKRKRNVRTPQKLTDQEKGLENTITLCYLHCYFSRLLDLTEYKASVLSLAVQCFTPAVSSSLPAHPQIFQLFLRLLGQDTPTSPLVPSPLSLAVHQITPEFFAGLGEVELQSRVLQALVNVLLATRHSEVTVQVKEGVAKVRLVWWTFDPLILGHPLKLGHWLIATLLLLLLLLLFVCLFVCLLLLFSSP